MNNETRKKHCVKKGQRFVPRDPAVRDRFQGCLLGGAVGDALGGAVELLDREYIVKKYGEPGIRDYAECYGGKGLITDDTQMTLYTAEVGDRLGVSALAPNARVRCRTQR